MIEKYSDVLIPQRADPCILLAPDSWYYFTASVNPKSSLYFVSVIVWVFHTDNIIYTAKRS
jgi:GH43 family beta-xylosidase